MDTAAVDYELPAVGDRADAGRAARRGAAARRRGPGRGARATATSRTCRRSSGRATCVVVNTTRVLPARLRTTARHRRRRRGAAARAGRRRRARRLGGAGAAEPQAAARARSWSSATTSRVVVGRRPRRGPSAASRSSHPAGTDLLDVLDRHGEVPLPPYITEPLADPERYQTTYADRPGSVAAPTAGLHLTAGGARRRSGPRGSRSRRSSSSSASARSGRSPSTGSRTTGCTPSATACPAATLDACAAAERVVAVGTTTVRALESAAATGRARGPHRAVHPRRPPVRAWSTRCVTNFHQPRSSLLVLVEAFVGPRWRDLYAEALAEGYRFLSFGDAMFLRGSADDAVARGHRPRRRGPGRHPHTPTGHDHHALLHAGGHPRARCAPCRPRTSRTSARRSCSATRTTSCSSPART